MTGVSSWLWEFRESGTSWEHRTKKSSSLFKSICVFKGIFTLDVCVYLQINLVSIVDLNWFLFQS